METSGFYIYKRQVINQMKRRIGDSPFIVEVDEIESIDIDEKIDFEIADAIYNFLEIMWRSYEKHKSFGLYFA